MECHRSLVARSGGFRSRQWMGFKPKRAGGGERIYSGVPPPRSFVAAAVDLTVVRATERYRELIAHLVTQCARLRET